MERVAVHVYVNEHGCHIWTGSLGVKGRPQMQAGSMVDGTRQPQLVHRLVWEAYHGPRPKGYDVHHTCENILCVNIAHLILRTHEDHARQHQLNDPDRPRRSRYAMHVRWHINKGIVKPGCEFCDSR